MESRCEDEDRSNFYKRISMENKAIVINSTEFAKVISKFLDVLEEKKIVKDYSISENERTVIVNFVPDIDIPESKEDIINKGLFRNINKVLKDLGYEQVEMKTVLLPMVSSIEDGNRVILHY